MKPLLIFGTGEMADLAYFYFKEKAGRAIGGFVLDGAYLREPRWRGVPVHPFESLEKDFSPKDFDLFVAIGSSNVNRLRAEKYAQAKKKGYALATYVSAQAVVHADRVGDNCFIMDHNNVHPYVEIGNDVIFSNANHVGHHSVVEDHCFITSNVVISGGVRVGEGSFLGVNATVRDHVSIGKYNVIGAGALILADTKDAAVYGADGTPARRATSDRLRRL